MKTSLVLIVALALNTGFLLSETLASLLQGINLWFLIGLEAILLVGYLANLWIQNLHKAYAIDLGRLNIFVIKDPNK